MLKHGLVAAMFFIFMAPAVALAQNLCPFGVTSEKLVCVIPQVYGPNGLILQNTSSQALGVAPFQNGLPKALSPLNSSIARQAAIMPLASPSSGVTFSLDPTTKAFIATTDSFGPILSERAETIGRNKFSTGFSYQYFKFDSLDGIALNDLPAVFTQPDTLATGINGGTICSIPPPNSPNNLGQCGFIRDVITTKNKVDLKLHQFTTFVTYGVTNRIDVSMAVPIESVRMGMTSEATILNISKTGVHQFPDNPPTCTHCLTSTSTNFREASGIGDITLRVKGTTSKSEKSATAVGLDIRVASGDALNFLGAGASGFKPFIVWSYRSRIAPHAFVGFAVNGSSLIAGDITTGTPEKLPGQLEYSTGVDVWITKRLTAAVDLVGQEVFQVQRLSKTTFTEPQACVDPTCNNLVTTPPGTDPNLAPKTASYNITNASFGAKFEPFSQFLITGNILIKLNDGGLRAKSVPLVSLSYTF